MKTSKIRKSAKDEDCTLRVSPNCQDGETVVLCHINSPSKGIGRKSIGRLDFLDSNGAPAKGNNKAQFILVFNPFKIGARESTYVTKEELMKAGE